MSEFEIKTEKKINMLKNGSGVWTTPAVHEKSGKFYKTGAAAVEELGLSVAAASRMIRGETEGPIRNATREEIETAMTIENARVYRVSDGRVEVAGEDGKWKAVPLTAGQARRRGIKLLVTEGELAKKPPAKMFAAVVWPDGAVTIRTSVASAFTMTRPSVKDVPQEIIDNASVVRM